MSPSLPVHPYLRGEGPIAFAHRGGTSEWPENTLPAFRHATELGYRYLETDVQVTADGVLAAFHDDDLQRTCGVAGSISQLPWSSVAQARVGGREPIPLMTELLEEFPDVRFNIDCKTDAAVEPLVALLRRTNSLDRVCVGAFSHRRLVRLRRLLGPGLCTSMSPREVLRWIAGRPSPAVRVAQVPTSSNGIKVVTERTVARAHRAGIQVHVWTIDDAAQMHALFDIGVDGIMTDQPETLRDVMRERGLWGR